MVIKLYTDVWTFLIGILTLQIGCAESLLALYLFVYLMGVAFIYDRVTSATHGELPSDTWTLISHLGHTNW